MPRAQANCHTTFAASSLHLPPVSSATTTNFVELSLIGDNTSSSASPFPKLCITVETGEEEIRRRDQT